MGGFLFGFDSSVINGAVDSIQGDFELGAFVTGFVVAIALLGCAVGAVVAGRLSDRLGRLKVMLPLDVPHAGISLRGPVLGLQRIVWVGVILSVFQQFVGINVIFYYSTSLWASVGFEESASFTISVITSVVNVAVTLVAIFLVDRVGRKPILLTGSVLMTVLLSEIFPSRIRGKALGVAAGAQWVANFLITVSFPAMSGLSLPVTYGMYALFAALSFLYVAWRVPETKGMELEQTETLFTREASEKRASS